MAPFPAKKPEVAGAQVKQLASGGPGLCPTRTLQSCLSHLSLPAPEPVLSNEPGIVGQSTSTWRIPELPGPCTLGRAEITAPPVSTGVGLLLPVAPPRPVLARTCALWLRKLLHYLIPWCCHARGDGHTLHCTGTVQSTSAVCTMKSATSVFLRLQSIVQHLRAVPCGG